MLGFGSRSRGTRGNHKRNSSFFLGIGLWRKLYYPLKSTWVQMLVCISSSSCSSVIFQFLKCLTSEHYSKGPGFKSHNFLLLKRTKTKQKVIDRRGVRGWNGRNKWGEGGRRGEEEDMYGGTAKTEGHLRGHMEA